MNDVEYLVIGGGPTGLGAACRLAEKKREWHLLEAENYFGGLAASFVDENGFTWDLGGHVQFSHYETFDRWMDLALGADGWLNHERESWIWVRERFVPYPFQHNLHRLDAKDRDRCVEGLRDAAEKRRTSNAERRTPKDFREWIQMTFGAGIADLFMIPYNTKVWAYPPEQMDYHWIADRVAVPDLDDILTSIRTGQDRVSWGPNRTFRFPKHGGTGSVWKAIGERLPTETVSLGSPVENVDVSRCVATTVGGEKWKYRCLISTVPLNALGRIAPGVTSGDWAEKLVYSATNVVGIGLEGQPPEHLKTKCWMYFPESHSPYYRITVFSNYSPNNVARPGEQWSLMTETSESPYKPVDHARLVEDTLRALRQDRLIPAEGPLSTQVMRRIPQAYPTPFLGRDALIDPLLRRFEEYGIFSRGRFGAWKYEVSNQDHSFAQGTECVERLVAGAGPEAEPTLFMSSVVNSRSKRVARTTG